MKQVIDEIQTWHRLSMGPSHLLAGGLGFAIAALIFGLLGGHRDRTDAPIVTGTIAHLEVQVSPSSRDGYDYDRADEVRARVYGDYIVVESRSGTRVIPADRINELRLYP